MSCTTTARTPACELTDAIVYWCTPCAAATQAVSGQIDARIAWALESAPPVRFAVLNPITSVMSPYSRIVQPVVPT